MDTILNASVPNSASANFFDVSVPFYKEQVAYRQACALGFFER